MMIPVKGIIIFFMKNTCGYKIKTAGSFVMDRGPSANG